MVTKYKAANRKSTISMVNPQIVNPQISLVFNYVNHKSANFSLQDSEDETPRFKSFVPCRLIHVKNN